MLTVQAPVTLASAAGDATRRVRHRFDGNLFSRTGAAQTPSPRMPAVFVFTFAMAGMFGLLKNANAKRSPMRLMKFWQIASVSALLATTLFMASCTALTTAEPKTAAKSYTVAVTASGTNAPTHLLTFTLTIVPQQKLNVIPPG